TYLADGAGGERRARTDGGGGVLVAQADGGLVPGGHRVAHAGDQEALRRGGDDAAVDDDERRAGGIELDPGGDAGGRVQHRQGGAGRVVRGQRRRDHDRRRQAEG